MNQWCWEGKDGIFISSNPSSVQICMQHAQIARPVRAIVNGKIIDGF